MRDVLKIDQLIRSRRRTVGLTITTDARLIVRAPHWTPVHEIERLISQKQSWITQKQALFRSRPRPVSKQFIEGEEFLFLGQTYKLCIVDDLSKAVVLGKDLMVAKAVQNVSDHIYLWYQRQALEHISQRVEYYAQLLGLKYRSIKVNCAKTRWGSCGHSGALNFTWRLIMAPPRVVDYVVVHELTHLKHMNHSSRFWNEVRRIVPDYKQDEMWLKNNSHALVI